jgi:hypothetical protein
VDDEGNEIVLPKKNKFLLISAKEIMFGIIESVELKGINLKLLCLELQRSFRKIV